MSVGSNDGEWQSQVEQFLSGGARATELRLAAAAAPAAPAARHFSAFVSEDLERATVLAGEMMQAAERDGIAAAVQAVAANAAQVSEELPGLVQYAFELFVTHYPPAREAFTFHSLERRQPALVLASAAPNAAGAAPPEDQLDFWREDPLLNEHHEHWHLVYPMRGRPQPDGSPPRLGDRHGELFAYMHEQMLARYDAERLALGLPRVVPFTDYRAPIAEGYDPGQLTLWDGEEWYQFRARPGGAHLSDLQDPFAERPGALLADQEKFRDRLLAAAAAGQYTLPTGQVPMTADNVGDTEEANINSVDIPTTENRPSNKVYGNHHNDGHIHFMYFDNTEPYGVMAATSTAVRDPIFWRWHKHVDSVFRTFQDHQPPNDFSDQPPAVIRDSDIIVAHWFGEVAQLDGAAVGAAAFGAEQWGGDFADASVKLSGGQTLVTTGELQTAMEERNLALGGQKISYLSHEDFAYFLRIENTSAQPLDVSIRIFLAPASQQDDRTAWIEMDRFRHALDASERAVVFRRSDESAVARKPALKPADLTPGDQPSPATDAQAWCDCGWPYTLLLPRGTAAGMPLRLLVMLSNGDDLVEPPADECSSISYCGLKDATYPDKRMMGYPFDRPFATSISNTVATHNNWAWRPLLIRSLNGPV